MPCRDTWQQIKETKKLHRRTRSVISTALTQKTTLLGTARILKKVLDCGKGLWKQSWGKGKKREIKKVANGEGEREGNLPNN